MAKGPPDRLAKALRDNLKRRKDQGRARAATKAGTKGLGTAPQSGLEDAPEIPPPSPKPAAKRI